MPPHFTEHPYYGPNVMSPPSFQLPLASLYPVTDPSSGSWANRPVPLSIAVGNPHVPEQQEHRAVGTSDVYWPPYLSHHGDYGSHILQSGYAYTVPPAFQTAGPASTSGWSHHVPPHQPTICNGASGSVFPTSRDSTSTLPSVAASYKSASGLLPQARGTTTQVPLPASVSATSQGYPLPFAIGTSAVRSPRSLIKLTPYNGTGSLETFLAKFENTARYLQWNDVDKYYHLCASLEGAAGQILWDAGPQAMTESIIRLLQTRFGNEFQAERFKAELCARRRNPGEPLQQLYQDVCRLVALAYPSSEVALSNYVAKEAFITALDGAKLQLEVMKKEPRNIEEALNYATKLEAYERSLSLAGHADDIEQRSTRRRSQKVFTVTDPPDADDPIALRKQVNDMQDALVQATRSLAALSAEPERSRITPSAAASNSGSVSDAVLAPSVPATGQTTCKKRSVREGGRGQGGRRRSKDTDPCRVCGQLGHWANECGQRTSGPIVKGVLSPRMTPTCVYVMAKFRNRPIRCLLDSGCERSVIGRRYIQGMRLKRSKYELFAANKTSLPVDGDADIHFTIDGHPMTTSVSVSPVIDELLLGSDWLVQNKCRWDFAAATVFVGDQLINTYQRKHTDVCRRIFVSEQCVVPPRHEANIPVRMMYDHIHCPKTEWAVEPRVLRPGVVAARTLLNDDRTYVVVRVLNYSDTSHTFKVDSYLSSAEPVISVVGSEQFGTTACWKSAPDKIAGKGSVNMDVLSGSEPLEPISQQSSCDASGPSFATHQMRLNTRHNRRCDDYRRLATIVDNPTPDQHGHIQCLIERLPDDLTAEQRVRAEEFIKSRTHVFSRSEFDIGRTDVLHHRIDTGDNTPHYERLRRHPTSQLPVIDQHVEQMLQHDVIEPAASSWCSNVVMVKKRDGSMCCIDYRKTNELIKKDKFPLPKIDTCLDMLNASRYFSSCDLRQGYWQTVIDEKDRDKTAFVTRKGQWRFKVLSFGLCNAPSQFARTMELVLSGLTYDICLVYLDDILVFSKTFEEHCDRLAAVFDRLERHTLKLKASKCHLFQRKVTFLGHVVSEKGIECDPDKITAIANWPRPKDVPEVRTFCGLASYYRSFVANFAHIARPLHELTRKNASFVWTDACEDAFNELKRRLTSSPILVAPPDEGTFVLDTDASDTALGLVLQQEQDGVLRVIAYASRALSDAERRYCITRRELLGVIYGLKKFRQHLLGRPIIVRTDHAALTYLMKTPEPIGQQGRWLDLLGEYDITIQHRPGRIHGNSDALSRRPCERADQSECRQCVRRSSTPVGKSSTRQSIDVQRADMSTVDTDEVDLSSVESAVQPVGDNSNRVHVIEAELGDDKSDTSICLEDIRRAQSMDDNIRPVVDRWREGKPPDHTDIRQYPEEARVLFMQWDSLLVQDDILYRRFHHPDGSTKFLQIVLPENLWKRYLEKLHADLGHFGQTKTEIAASRRIYFPGLRSYTKLIVKNCKVCNLHQRGRQAPRQTALKPMREFRPMAVLHADLVGPVPEGKNSQNQRGFQYILSVVDSATRYLWLRLLRHKTADAVAVALYEDIITRVSVPSAILTDQGREFTGEVVKRLCDRLGIHRLRTSAYHPQTDAKCERIHSSQHNNEIDRRKARAVA